MKQRVLLLVLALATLGGVTFAQTSQLMDPIKGVALNNFGVGARAMGMGGAFTAIADDGTAATWNPAGLSQLKRPQVTMVYTINDEDRKTPERGSLTVNNNAYYPYESLEKRHTSSRAFQFISGTYPFIWKDRQCAVQVSYNRIFQPPTMSGERNLTYYHPTGVTEDYYRSVNLASKGGIDMWTGTFSIELFKRIHFGLSINYLKSEYSYTTNVYGEGGLSNGNYEEDFSNILSDQFSFHGFTFDLGMLWKPHDKVSVGVVYHSKFNRPIKETYTNGPGYFNSTTSGSSWQPEVSNWTGKVTWPQGVGAGIAWRPVQNLTIASDFAWTQWRDGKIHYDGFASGADTWGYPNAWVGRQNDVYTVRLGTEYTFLMKNGWVVPVRGGYFRTNTTSNFFDSGWILNNTQTGYYMNKYTQTGINGFTLGGGLTVNYFQADIAYIRTTGQDHASRYTTNNNWWAADSNMKSNQLILSMIVRF